MESWNQPSFSKVKGDFFSCFGCGYNFGLAGNKWQTVYKIVQKSWEQTDQLLEVESINKSLLAWTKAIFLLVLGTGMLGILAEPLIERVQNFSEAANMPSFFISFILVPLATNARIAISAISEARRKKPRTTSLTFSEVC